MPQRLKTNTSTENGSYRVVQLYVDNTPYMHFAHDDVKWHDQVLGDFLKIMNIDFKLATEGDLAPKGDGYNAVGMGKAIISDNRIVFCGESYDYGIALDVYHLKSFVVLYRDELSSEKEIVFNKSGVDIKL
ncbi:MAG: hypothetical protein V1870_04775 [Candidatus Aenigmatarchaeota archaeon]